MMIKKLATIVLFALALISCVSKEEKISIDDHLNETNSDLLEISFEVDKEIYEQTDYGEPPQIAVWLETADSLFYRTVWVTRRTGKKEWQGKVDCPVSLPYWNFRKENESNPGFWQKMVDAISGATVAEGTIKKSIRISKSKKYVYFIEVNASGDYNGSFKKWSDKDVPDSEGNGQPSIIYSGGLDSDRSFISGPVLIGRTNQHTKDNILYSDIEKITTAKDLIKNIRLKLN